MSKNENIWAAIVGVGLVGAVWLVVAGGQDASAPLDPKPTATVTVSPTPTATPTSTATAAKPTPKAKATPKKTEAPEVDAVDLAALAGAGVAWNEMGPTEQNTACRYWHTSPAGAEAAFKEGAGDDRYGDRLWYYFEGHLMDNCY